MFFGEKIPTKAEQEKRPEKMAELSFKLLRAESGIDDSKKAGGFMLTTVLAMGLAFGMMPARAEAQVRGIGPQGTGVGGQIAGEVFREGVSGIDSSIDKSESAKREKIEHDYVAALTHLEEMERNLDSGYIQERNRLTNAGEDTKNLDTEYRMAKAKIAQERTNLKKDYEKKIKNSKARGEVFRTILQGARGW